MLRKRYGVKKAVLIAGKTDMRMGIDGLMSIVSLKYGYDISEPYNVFLFCGNKRDRIKALYFDGQGMVLINKRLLNGAYKWPRDTDEAIELDEEHFQELLDCASIDF